MMAKEREERTDRMDESAVDEGYSYLAYSIVDCAEMSRFDQQQVWIGVKL
jgi:hypothetical protein